MLKKIGVAALLGTIGLGAVAGGTAMAAEPCAPAPVVVAPRRVVVAPPAPIVTTVAYGYGYGGARYREEARLSRQRREAEARRHVEWLRHHDRNFRR
ncbi:MAG TPA: hypothetical protein VN947_02195 [Polyangia bacterium]|nr:hypothetical protein [Polyangia bacterium]